MSGQADLSITDVLEEYAREVTDEIRDVIDAEAKQAAENLRATSPRGRRSKYARGWVSEPDGDGAIVYNKTEPSLTHLLEHGHATLAGGRTAARPHIGPEEQATAERLVSHFAAD